MSRVRIISISKVQLPTNAGTDYPSPGSTIPLSFFDVRWIPHIPIKTLLLYPSAKISSSSFDSFKSSLALALPHFHILAGDLTYLPNTDDVAIVCSDESGVTLIEAESDLDICRLAGDSMHDVESFFHLVPNEFHEEMPMPVLAVQFTKFTGCGVAVGISMHHAAMDAWGLSQFLDFWTKTCRDGIVPSNLTPIYDRAIIMYPGKEEIKKEILNARAPNLVQIPPIASISDRKSLIRRVFTVDLATIQLLKQRAAQKTATDISSPRTTFQVLAAHTWISIARARGITAENNKPTFMLIFMDGRTLLPSPMSISYTGNCVFPCIVHSTGSALMSHTGLGQTCGIIAETVRTNRAELMGGTVREILTLNLALLSGLKVAFIGSNRMQLYDKDFGWGKPEFEGLVSMANDGDVVMAAGKEKGSVQITVGLKEDMDAFIHAFQEGLES
ncbi:hypothetical protein LUZ61_005127 [Rhynchospora tenuis]|uniref:Uncharacterized protein n=1 Tax=Rhynchospora tenuis TaxID=198213 RepID=A0AAD5ZP38_9POAL|nr:hypothetical protein LUZ61_005127 [Rhynchospora tenuis]